MNGRYLGGERQQDLAGQGAVGCVECAAFEQDHDHWAGQHQDRAQDWQHQQQD